MPPTVVVGMGSFKHDDVCDTIDVTYLGHHEMHLLAGMLERFSYLGSQHLGLFCGPLHPHRWPL